MKAIIFDFYRTLFNPDQDALFEGVPELLQNLSEQGYVMFLFGAGDGTRKDLIKELKIDSFFEEMLFKDEKTAEDMLYFRNLYPDREFFVVGDRIEKEIRAGNQAGIKTIWVKRGKFSHIIPDGPDDQPWRTISNILDLPNELS